LDSSGDDCGVTIWKPLDREERIQENVERMAWYIFWGKAKNKVGPFKTLKEAKERAVMLAHKESVIEI